MSHLKKRTVSHTARHVTRTHGHIRWRRSDGQTARRMPTAPAHGVRAAVPNIHRREAAGAGQSTRANVSPNQLTADHYNRGLVQQQREISAGHAEPEAATGEIASQSHGNTEWKKLSLNPRASPLGCLGEPGTPNVARYPLRHPRFREILALPYGAGPPRPRMAPSYASLPVAGPHAQTFVVSPLHKSCSV